MKLAALAASLLLWAGAAMAQSVQELEQQLKERDERIRELGRRLEALESQAGPEDDELSRALERTLVQQGAMVLPSRVYEVEPQVSYAHWDRDRNPFRYTWVAALNGRAGIGWDTQVEARVPYVHAATATDSATELGDASFAVIKQVAREKRDHPGLLVSLGWVTHSGQDPFRGRVPTGSGFSVPQAALTAVKRDEPLVYFGSVSYAAPRSREFGGVRVEPGNLVGVRGGAILAATPHSSVSASLNLTSVAATRVDGQRVPDSDSVLGTLGLGLGIVVSRRIMVNAAAEFRVSGQVPNFRLVLGLPIRF